MRLENTLALTNGRLLNTPSITSFNAVVFEARFVKRGNLFIARDASQIEEAVLHGAYGILFDTPAQISDTEIAWIKVESVKDALKRLLRFRLIEKEIRAFSCDPIVLKLALQTVTESRFIALEGDIFAISRLLWEIDPHTIVLFSPTMVDSELFPSASPLPKVPVETITIVEQTLFETSFIHESHFYERQLLSPFFIPYLEKLLHFFKIQTIGYRLKPFLPIEHFQPVFVNRNLEIMDFGNSDMVLIFEKESAYAQQQIDFLSRQANWARIIYLLPDTVTVKLHEQKNIFTYKSKDDIIHALSAVDFHFALIVGSDRSILNNRLAPREQLTLNL